MSQPRSQSQFGPLQRLVPGYSSEPRPLAGYLALMGVFNLIFAAFLILLRTQRRSLPEYISTADVLMLGVAAHKLTRLLSSDPITSPLRAPFTHFEGATGIPSEIAESPREGTYRKAIGELVTCGYCMAQWVAAFLGYGLVLAPRLTRFIASIFAVVAISDLLNLVYETAMELTSKSGKLLEQRIEEGQADS